jgi:solute:Na+ symporter, SSS family
MLKFMMLINLCSGPAMLMGFLWRRTNTAAVWASMGTGLMLTIVIPAMVMFWPGARYSERLLLETRSPLLEKTYIASVRDVEARAEHIAIWERMRGEGLAEGVRPEPLVAGSTFAQTYAPQARAVYWDGGIRQDSDGRRHGHGFFKPELWILDKLGVDFQAMTPARVEMMSLLFRLILPFVIVLLVGSLTRPMAKRDLDVFFAKQRTPVDPIPDLDRKAVEENQRHPDRLEHLKLFPGTNWEFGKLEAYDAKGLAFAVAGGLSFILFVIIISRLG